MPTRQTQCDTLPSYPATLPRSVKFQPIAYPNDVLGQMRQDWSLHMVNTGKFISHAMRAISGYHGYVDTTGLEDLVRTGRFDIASHYNRALDANEPSPITNAEQITGAAGRQLVVLLDRAISLKAAVAIKALDVNGLFTAKELDQRVPEQMLLNLGLICNRNEYRDFDPMEQLIANGRQVVSLIANVWAIRYLNAVVELTAFDQAAYDAFNQACEARLGATAEQVWLTHLNQVTQLVERELVYCRKNKNRGFLGLVRAGVSRAEITSTVTAGEQLQLHAFNVANVFAFSVGDEAVIKTDAFFFP